MEEAREILSALGYSRMLKSKLPSLTLMALCGVKPDGRWQTAARGQMGISQGIEVTIRNDFRHPIAENTRETIRKAILKPWVQLGIAEHNPGRPEIPTNSSLNFYALSESALQVIRRYGTASWATQLAKFSESQARLVAISSRRKRRAGVPVELPGGAQLVLSAGSHSELIAAVIEDLLPHFFPGAGVLYAGDTAQKDFHSDAAALRKLGLALPLEATLPDLILHDRGSQTIIWVEAVTSVGPIDDARLSRLQEMGKTCKLGKLYITAFLDFKTFSRFAGQLAWDTEAWVAERPDHLIHFNGDKFLVPRR